ncbi:DUF4240 domain-containing protein [Roseibium sp. HPY-6]|uniref:DUF4240 domain-containing protein n=1 Tax=Roseibium sp. HPY-6 TaxID=3229852 RepID=UPI00338DEC9A
MINEIEITKTEVFRPRFDDISKDGDRLMEHVVELIHAGRLEKKKGVSAFDQYIKATDRRLMEAYFERALYAEIERYYCYGFEVAFSWPHSEMLQDIDRLTTAGQGQRAIRIWRHYLALMKQHYWQLIDVRRRGFKKAPYLQESEASQRAEWEAWTGRVPEYKRETLAMMDAARDCFERSGASPSQLSRLSAERAEVESEKRRRPEGKPDARKMDEDVFWEIIGSPEEGRPGEQIDALPDRLARFKATAIKSFDALLHEMDARAYRSDIWALAYLLNDGCSDDEFAGFRAWIILQGREIFEATLADPDSFDVSQAASGGGSGLSIWNAPLLAHEMRQGKPMKRKTFRLPDLGGNDLQEAGFEEALPRVAAAMNRR